MHRLGPLCGHRRDEYRQYIHLFARSLNDPIVLRLHGARMVSTARLFAYSTRRHVSEVTREEIECLAAAMEAARLAYLQIGSKFRPLKGDNDIDLRSVVNRASPVGGHWPFQAMGTSQLTQAVRRAVIDGVLVFVPRPEELRACVEAIEASRYRRSVWRSPAQENRFDPRQEAQRMMGRPPRTPSPDTPLSNAQPFDWEPEAPSDVTQQLSGSEGTPRSNQAQNKQTGDIAKILRLTPGQARQLHNEISGEGLGFHEIMERAKDMFNLWD